MSPRYSPDFTGREPRRRRTGLRRATVGKESTSVEPFFLRNFSFIRAISASLTRQTVRLAWSSPSSFFTRRRNDSNGRRARRAALWRLLTASRSPLEMFILAEFLFRVLSRIVSLAFPLCRSRCFRRAAGELHHTLHKRG